MNTILLIDSRNEYGGLQQALEISGFRVQVADNDLDGLAALLRSSFDLVIVPTSTSRIDLKMLAEYLSTIAAQTILVSLSRKHELEISQLPEGTLPGYFTRFFIETIQYLHAQQQPVRHPLPKLKNILAG